jgi:hypothetical protein
MGSVGGSRVKIWVDHISDRITLARFRKSEPKERHAVYCGVLAERQTLEIDAKRNEKLFLVMADFPEKFDLNGKKSVMSEFSDWIVTVEPEKFIDTEENPVTIHPIVSNKWMDI